MTCLVRPVGLLHSPMRPPILGYFFNCGATGIFLVFSGEVVDRLVLLTLHTRCEVVDNQLMVPQGFNAGVCV